MNAALTATLRYVAQALAGAVRPWWVVGSTALVLHGVAVEPRDVDVLVGQGDAHRLGWPFAPGGTDPRFRSAMFWTWRDPPLPVEFMAGFEVRQGAAWLPVRPQTRRPVQVEDATVYVPERAELADMLMLFGREKDLARAALL